MDTNVYFLKKKSVITIIKCAIREDQKTNKMAQIDMEHLGATVHHRKCSGLLPFCDKCRRGA